MNSNKNIVAEDFSKKNIHVIFSFFLLLACILFSSYSVNGSTINGRTIVTADNFQNYFAVNGDAKWDGTTGTLWLTKDGKATSTTHSGNATLKNKINLDSDFVLKGEVLMGTKAKPNQNDGIGFGFHQGKTTDVGKGAEYMGLMGLKNSFGFKLDTWNNTERNDPIFGSSIRGGAGTSFGAFITSTEFNYKTTDTSKVSGTYLDKDNQIKSFTGTAAAKPIDSYGISASNNAKYNSNGTLPTGNTTNLWVPILIVYSSSDKLFYITYNYDKADAQSWALSIKEFLPTSQTNALSFLISGSNFETQNGQGFRFGSDGYFTYAEYGIINSKFVDDSSALQNLSDPLQDYGTIGQIKTLDSSTTEIKKLENEGKYYLSDASISADTDGQSVGSFDLASNQIKVTQQPQTVTYVFKKNNASIITQNTTIYAGTTWSEDANLQSITDYQGKIYSKSSPNNPLTMLPGIISNNGNTIVNTNKVGSYEVTYSYTDSKSGYQRESFPVVSAKATVTVVPCTVTATYKDSSGKNLLDDLELKGSVGETYETTAKNIPGYHLVSVPSNSSGRYIAGDIIVEYKYKKNDYKVHFDSNGGSGTMPDQLFAYDVTQKLTDNLFVRGGYQFKGWNTKANGSGTPYSNEASVSNLTADNNGFVTLFAQWKPDIKYAQITYIDDTKSDNNQLKVVNLSGEYGTTDSYRTATSIADYESQGYQLVSDNYPDDGVVYNQVSDDSQKFEIHFTHKTTINEENHSVLQTIHYIYSDGSKAKDDYKNELKFKRTVTTDEVDNSKTFSSWESLNGNSFVLVKSPQIVGYTASPIEVPSIENIKGGSEDQISNVIYTPNTEHAEVRYIDDTTNTVLNVKELSGTFNTVDSYRTAATINTYESQGYQLVSDNYPTDGVIYNQDGITQTFEVHLTHANSIKTETKEVKQTIQYKYSDGTKASDEKISSITFVRTVTTDNTNGIVTYSDWSSLENTTTFQAVNSPTIAGYTADQLVIPEISGITNETKDIDIIVTYHINIESAKITYFDETLGKNIDVGTVEQLTTNPVVISGEYGSVSSYRTKATIDALEAKGYLLTSDDYPETGAIYDQDGKIKSYKVSFQHTKTDTIESKKVTQTINYIYSDGTKASDSYNFSLDFDRKVTTDNVSGNKIYDNWIPKNGTTFKAVVSPIIKGYTADKVTVASIDNVSGNTGNINITVTYSKNKITIDDNGDDITTDPLTKVKNDKSVTDLSKISDFNKSNLPRTGEKSSWDLLVVGLLSIGCGLLIWISPNRKR